MKLVQVLALSVLVLFAAIRAHADGVSTDDARAIVGSGGDPDKCGLPDFTINANATKANHGSGFKNCFNDSSEDWIGLTITGTAKAGPIVCITDIFSLCTSTSVIDPKNPNREFVTITLSGGEIAPGEDFFTNFNDNGDPFKGDPGTPQGSWIGLLTVTPMTAPVPEPGTIALFLMGLGGLWFWGKRHALKSNA